MNLEFIDGGRMMSGQDITAEHIDWRYVHTQTFRRSVPFTFINRRKYLLSSVLPVGFTPYLSVSDGNCLFSSISVCLFGDTTRSTALRYAALVHGVKHLSHYLKSVCFLPSH